MTSLVTNLNGTEKPKLVKMGNSFNHKDMTRTVQKRAHMRVQLL